ncbi:MAG: AAA family ATPase, partial [Elusimicrobia bacterium]|nr:AAA family ATPase [Elusimicrobiota bacterium]
VRENPNNIRLEWRDTKSDAYFNANMLSDGTLRFICLATLLLQPDPPSVIILDEPELGLHPAAIALLAEMIKSASQKSQIIISTQSVTLINHFSPEDIIVAERKQETGESVFTRLDKKAIAHWLEDYALGAIWEKNIIGGRP